jgi:hypothetical protein
MLMHRCLLRALRRFNKIKAEKKRKEAERKQRETELRKQMANLRIIQKTLVYVIGLSPRMADEEVCAHTRLSACLATASSPPRLDSQTIQTSWLTESMLFSHSLHSRGTKTVHSPFFSFSFIRICVETALAEFLRHSGADYGWV